MEYPPTVHISNANLVSPGTRGRDGSLWNTQPWQSQRPILIPWL